MARHWGCLSLLSETSTGLWMTSTKALSKCPATHWTDRCGEWWMCMEGVNKSEQRYALVSSSLWRQQNTRTLLYV